MLLVRQVLQLLFAKKRPSTLRKVSHLLLIAGYSGPVAFAWFPKLIPGSADGPALIGTLIAMLAGGILGIKLSAVDGNVHPKSCHA
jgi:hypothetical protein